MNNLLPWIHIFVAIFFYILIALLSSAIIRKAGENLKEIKGRTSSRMLVIGAVAVSWSSHCFCLVFGRTADWVPIMLHFAADAINMVVFDITGRYSLFTISPSLGEQQRAVYRVIYALVLMVTFNAFYGIHTKIT